jgi:ABC-type multidrug transport system ATPase subunit
VPVIATQNLTKHYGKIEALKDVSLTVEPGAIFGLLGQNGAGKTTLIKILLGITGLTDGSATLLGQPAGTARVRRSVGYLPEDHHFPDYHSGASLLDFYGALLEVPRAERRRRIPEVLELVGLKGRMDYKIRTYSKGMKQRLGIAQAIFHDPAVIFLDEPTDGVDPVGRRHIRDLMQSLKGEGKTIFFNSHLLGEVELVCDRVAILQRGSLIREGDIATLTRHVRRRPGAGPGVPRRRGRPPRLPRVARRRVLGGRPDRRPDHRPRRRSAAAARPEPAPPRREAPDPRGPVRGDGGGGRAGRGRGRPPAPPFAPHRETLMKFLAVLRDSLREALDTKVFYVMVGLSLLVILLVGSVSYRPVSVEEEARRTTERMSWFLARIFEKNNLGASPHYDIRDFEQTNPGAQPWDTDYRFALTVEFADDKQAEAARAGQKASVAEVERALRPQFLYLKNLKVTAAEPQDPREVRYLVTADGKGIRRQDWPHEPVILFAVPVRFWHSPIGSIVYLWEYTLISLVGAAIALLISVIITAFFIPNMLRKGTVDMLLVKPIHRWTLLLYKYVGGMTFMFLNTALVVCGVWLVLGLRTGLWGTGFLFSVAVLTFQFAVYYAVSTLFAVLTRSPIVAILMSCLAWFLIAIVVGYGYQGIDATRKLRDIASVNSEVSGQEAPPDMPEKLLPDWVYTTADVVHFVTPHLYDMDILTKKLIIDDVYPPDNPERKVATKVYGDFRWTETLAVTAVYIAALLGLSCWWFARRDY